MTRVNRKIETAAKKFYMLLTDGKKPWDYSDDPAKPLVLAAFKLYAESWDGFDIHQWQWPANELRDGAAFKGNEPWTILLRHAVAMSAT